MYSHLYSKQNACPGSVVDIELTDDIKRYIMLNRIYHKPENIYKHQNVRIYNYNYNYTIYNAQHYGDTGSYQETKGGYYSKLSDSLILSQ